MCICCWITLSIEYYLFASIIYFRAFVFCVFYCVCLLRFLMRNNEKRNKRKSWIKFSHSSRTLTECSYNLCVYFSLISCTLVFHYSRFTKGGYFFFLQSLYQQLYKFYKFCILSLSLSSVVTCVKSNRKTKLFASFHEFIISNMCLCVLVSCLCVALIHLHILLIVYLTTRAN